MIAVICYVAIGAVALVYSERFETAHEARSREWRLKQLTRAEKLTLIKAKENAEHEKNGA